MSLRSTEMPGVFGRSVPSPASLNDWHQRSVLWRHGKVSPRSGRARLARWTSRPGLEPTASASGPKMQPAGPS
eukprot:12557043-Alexandrium_andersonii.AAC.1